MPAVRPIGHEQRLSIVDHLDELRSRLIVSIGVLVVLFSFCYWQNGHILQIANRPLEKSQKSSKKSRDPLAQAATFQKQVGRAMAALAPALRGVDQSLARLSATPGVAAADRAQAALASRQLKAATVRVAAAAASTPTATGRRPITTGVAEPFTATITVAAYAALLLALPFLLFQLYAFVLPAFRPGERKVALPLMAMVPVLFVCGVAFGYFIALPRAVGFLQNFNSDRFDILIQAKDYYRFVILVLALTGLTFQIPVGVLAVTRAGIVTVRQLWKGQGYVILVLSIVAAVATPTPDPVTMLITMLPLVLLYELSIGLAWIMRPRGETVASRFGGWWDDDDDDDDGDVDGDAHEVSDDARGDATGDQTPVS